MMIDEKKCREHATNVYINLNTTSSSVNKESVEIISSNVLDSERAGQLN